MRLTFSLDEKLVKKVRRIAADRRTTLGGLVREHLEKLATEGAATDSGQREQEALELSFKKYHFKIGKRRWKREDLYDRT